MVESERSFTTCKLDDAELGAQFLSVHDISNPVLKTGADYWDGLRGVRQFPSRDQISPRGLGALLTNTLLVGVIGEGRDFKFRIVGNGPVAALGCNLQGVLVSEMEEGRHLLGLTCRSLYTSVYESRAPRAIACNLPSNICRQHILYSEGLFLPLGPDDDHVDFILGFVIYEHIDI